MEGTHQNQCQQGGENICKTTCSSCCSAIFGRDNSGEKTWISEGGFGFTGFRRQTIAPTQATHSRDGIVV